MNVNVMSVKAMNAWIKKKGVRSKGEVTAMKNDWRIKTPGEKAMIYNQLFEIPFPENLDVVSAFKEHYENAD